MPAQKRSFPDAPNDHHRHAKYHHQEEEEEEEDNYKSDGSALFMYSFLLSFLLDFSIFFFSLFLLSLFRFSPRRQIRVRSLSLSHHIYALLTNFYFLFCSVRCCRFDPARVVRATTHAVSESPRFDS